SLGTLTSGIGHEINNPTNYVHGSAQNMVGDLNRFKNFLFELAGDDADPEMLKALKSRMEPLYQHVSTIKEGSQRIAGIVRDLRTFSRRGTGKQTRVDLKSCLESTLNLVRPNFKEWVDIQTDFHEHLIIPGAQGELNQVFMNLSVNACQAVKSRFAKGGMGHLVVRTTIEDEMGVVSFIDNGGGIPGSVRNRIFEPFFTTKPVGEGTGLGLSISFKIIRNHGGRINVTSEEGKGSIFNICLPLAGTDPEKPAS
ncbi:MAG: ATP-binding protein, partial [Acidobacteriota bacterium]|nr:ATP-binding protein [Acidobacteriota bacterium]